ncbi:hypothetical protein KHQ81_15755 (plasmid) [Mycoplasmatota bacterium]|nr:hypothetical protein KHQ81_15755 [Mycoplasmatota bacterium]
MDFSIKNISNGTIRVDTESYGGVLVLERNIILYEFYGLKLFNDIEDYSNLKFNSIKDFLIHELKILYDIPKHNKAYTLNDINQAIDNLKTIEGIFLELMKNLSKTNYRNGISYISVSNKSYDEMNYSEQVSSLLSITFNTYFENQFYDDDFVPGEHFYKWLDSNNIFIKNDVLNVNTNDRHLQFVLNDLALRNNIKIQINQNKSLEL